VELSLRSADRDFADEARTWLAEHLVGDFARYGGVGGPADDEAWEVRVAWDRELAAGGWLGLSWPAEYGGRGLPLRHEVIFAIECARANPPYRASVQGLELLGPMLLARGSEEQKRRFLPPILRVEEFWGQGFSEPGAGSDLSAMRTEIQLDGDSVVIDGEKMWVTVARYADLLLIVGRHGDGGAVVAVPADAPGVHVERVPDPLGCRAAGHAHVRLDNVRLPADRVLGGGGQPMSLIFTAALSYGRISVAWGCVGILRACLAAATAHARSREQSGKPIAEHQLVARHLADLLIAEQVATRVCEHASQRWDSSAPDMGVAAVLAKHVSAGHAARGASTAVQVLGSAGAQDGHVVARAHRDAKLMEIIEGSNEICQLILAQHALSVIPD
jgi:methoxymalonate biosynthesis protein